MLIRSVSVYTLSRNSEHGGTNSPLWLIINENGRDRIQEEIRNWRVGASGGHPLRGGANRYRCALGQASAIEGDNLTNSSVRIAIGGADVWDPLHVFVFADNRFPIAGAMNLGATRNATLSTDPDEGVQSLPLPLIPRADLQTEIRRVLVVFDTVDEKWADTKSKLRLEILADGVKVVDYEFPDTPQNDFGRGAANLYLVPALPFRREQAYRARLFIQGHDLWRPAWIGLYGLSSDEGIGSILPLADLLLAYDGVTLSTDVEEGSEFLDLPPL